MIISMKGDLGKFRPRSSRAVPQAIHGNYYFQVAESVS